MAFRTTRRPENRKIEKGLVQLGRVVLRKVAGMNEFIAKPRISFRIEQCPQPVDEKRHTADAARLGMIGHPDIDVMPHADIDGNEVGADCGDVCR